MLLGGVASDFNAPWKNVPSSACRPACNVTVTVALHAAGSWLMLLLCSVMADCTGIPEKVIQNLSVAAMRSPACNTSPPWRKFALGHLVDKGKWPLEKRVNVQSC